MLGSHKQPPLKPRNGWHGDWSPLLPLRLQARGFKCVNRSAHGEAGGLAQRKKGNGFVQKPIFIFLFFTTSLHTLSCEPVVEKLKVLTSAFMCPTNDKAYETWTGGGGGVGACRVSSLSNSFNCINNIAPIFACFYLWTYTRISPIHAV